MKPIKFILIIISLFFANQIQAQISVNLNLGTPPLWGPQENAQARYYYLPDVESYYDIQTSKFIYYSGNHWVHQSYLPKAYKNYDLYNGYKVVLVDYKGNTPYSHFKEHQKKYYKGYHDNSQKTIGKKPKQAKHNSKNSKHNKN